MSSVDQPTPDDLIERFRQLTADTAPDKPSRHSTPPDESPGDVDDSRKFRFTPRSSDQKATMTAILGLATKRLLLGILTIIAIIYLSYLGLDMARGTDFQSAAVMAVNSTGSYISMLVKGDLGMTAESSFSLLPVPINEILPEIAKQWQSWYKS